MARLLNASRSGRGMIGAVVIGLAWLLSWSPAWTQGVVLHAPEPSSVEYGFLNNSDMDKAGVKRIQSSDIAA